MKEKIRAQKERLEKELVNLYKEMDFIDEKIKRVTYGLSLLTLIDKGNEEDKEM